MQKMLKEMKGSLKFIFTLIQTYLKRVIQPMRTLEIVFILCFRYVNQIITAVKENGNQTDLKANNALARVVKEAQAQNIPKVL